MICFNCGIKLHTGGEKECQICGVRFALKCPFCEFPNPVMSRYCFNCGTKIMEPGAQSSVQNFDTLAENRKNVAVIFADVSGFTALSENKDPEEVREIINDCFNYITKPVYELEGTIDKYMGDCVMILFGAKYTHSDDAKKAVICAIKMMELIKEFSEQRLSLGGFSLTLSIGVNYGLVVTGSVGNYFDKDYTVMGDIVNTAQRMQSNAGSGTILVSESVYLETRDVIRYSECQEIAVKNKENSVRCYSPVELGVDYSFEQEMPLIGRKVEMDKLNSIYNSALNTGVHSIAVIGEGGIGKTRLLKEFASKLGNDIKKIWVDCSSTSQNRVYFVISGILANIMNINSEDGASIKQHRLMSFLDYILGSYSDVDIKRAYNFLGLILGFGRDNEFQNILNSMSFDNISREILKQLSIFFANMSRKYRFMVIIDDVHWADASSMYLIKELALSLNTVNAAFVFSSRCDLEELKIMEKGKYHALRMYPFGEGEIKSMACGFLECEDIDSTLLDAVAKFTKGNPLYVREFLLNIKRADRYSVNNGIAYGGMGEITSLPNSIQGLILANLSELDDTTKGFLQAASIMGKEFKLSLVGNLIDCNIDEMNLLRLPVQMNIISSKSVHASAGVVEKVFAFKQDVEREAIYDSILNKSKRELHKKVGELIELKYFREIENYYEILCVHFQRAGLNKKAEEYYYKTALKCKNDFNLSSALEYYDKFLELAKLRPEAEEDSRIVRSYMDIGHIYFITASYELALEYLNKALDAAKLSDDVYAVKLMIAGVYKEQGAYEDALTIFDEIGPKIRQGDNIYGRLLQIKCQILHIIGNQEALGFAKKSEKILLRTKDYHSLSETMNQAGIIYFAKGDVDNSLFYLNKSYKYAEKINNLEVMAKVSGNLGIIYHSTGMISKALESYNKSMDISKKISDLQGYITGCINLGILYMEKGMFTKAGLLFNDSLSTSREISSKLYECESLTNLGDLMYELGLDDKALCHYNQSLEVAGCINVPVEEGVVFISIARLYLKQGQYEKVPEALEKAYTIFDSAGEVMYLADYYRYKSLYELAQGNIGVALEYCDKAISISVEFKSDSKKLKALKLKGNIMMRTGRLEEAVELFSNAAMLAEQVESDYEAAKAYHGRYTAYSRLGRQEDAEGDLNKARECMTRVDQCGWSKVIEQQLIP